MSAFWSRKVLPSGRGKLVKARRFFLCQSQQTGAEVLGLQLACCQVYRTRFCVKSIRTVRREARFGREGLVSGEASLP